MNRSQCFAFIGIISTVLASVVATPYAWAQGKTTAKLPSATKVMDDSSAAQGGKSAYDKIKSAVIRGTMTIAAQKISGTMESRIKFPDKVYQMQQIKGIGKFETGYNGTIGWSHDPINGLRTLTGPELNQMKSQADDIKSSNWRAQYTKAELLGIRKVGTVDTYAIRLTSKRSPKPVILFIDTKTKLPVRTDQVVETAQGSVPTQSFASDYRVVNGVKIPFKTRQVVGGVSEVLLSFDSVKFNESVDDKLFEKPSEAAVKADATTKP